MSIDRATAANLLRRLRESRGWSWADLARAMRDVARQRYGLSSRTNQVASIQRTIARWESGTGRTRPGDHYQVLLAQIYARTQDGGLALGLGSDFAILLDALYHFGIPESRCGQLAELVVQGSNHEFGPEPGPEVVAPLSRAVSRINQQVGSTPFVHLCLLLTPIVETCRRLLHTDRAGARDDVMGLATSAFSLATRLAFETRDDGVAMSLYRDATRIAGRLSDRRHSAGVRTSQTMVIMHATGDLRAAGQTARAAVADAHDSASYAARARAHAVHAEVCACAGLDRQARAALERAWTTIDQLQLDDAPSGFNADHLWGFDGLCRLHLGNANDASDRLARSVATLDKPRDAVQRGIILTDLALARLRLDDPIACVDLMHRAVDVAAGTGGRVPILRVQQVRKELRPWRAENFVADLDDHIHDALIGR